MMWNRRLGKSLTAIYVNIYIYIYLPSLHDFNYGFDFNGICSNLGVYLHTCKYIWCNKRVYGT